MFKKTYVMLAGVTFFACSENPLVVSRDTKTSALSVCGEHASKQELTERATKVCAKTTPPKGRSCATHASYSVVGKGGR